MKIDEIKYFVKEILSRKMLSSFLMGFSSGLPLLLTLSILQAWMKEVNIDLKLIGVMSLIGLPYTLKYLWAPVFDRFTLPFLGRRRGWLLVSQILLMVAIVLLGFSNPREHIWFTAFAAFLVSFFSASQDIVIDAYRREDLDDNELGLGSSLYVNGYRIGLLVAGSGGLMMADHISFKYVYSIMALFLIPGIITTLFSPEPKIDKTVIPKSLKEAVIDPLIDYFKRDYAILILCFILLYKIGDTMAGAMTTPFYLDLGFTKTEIGVVVKLFGFWATIAGGLIGGLVILKTGIIKALWFFGFLQAFSTAGFSLLAIIGYSIPTLSFVIAFENFSSGMGTAAFVAFMGSITNKRFTATQFALLSGLMGVPRVLAAAPTGFLVEQMGWVSFFILCTLIAIPGMMIIFKLQSKDLIES